MKYSTLLVLILGIAGVFPRTARAQLSYVDISSGLDVPELDTGQTELEFGDVNGDGHVDIVSIGDHGSPGLEGGEHGVMVWFGDGGGNWSVFQYGDFGYGGVALGDVNNDQLMDVAYGMHHNSSGVDFGDQLIEAALGDGTGHFWTPWDDGLATNGETWGMFGTDLADVDNDGDLDIGCVSFGGSNGVRIYVNNMDGTWTQSSALASGQSSMLFQFGDVNGDGHADFAAAYGSATVALGDGAGGFVASLSGARAGVSLGDVNNDGRDDVVYVTAGGGIEVYTLTSPGVWQDFSGNLPTSGGFRLTQIADMNLDGHGDVVAFAPGSDSPGTIAVYGGDGSGNWQLLASISTPENHGYAALRAGVDVDHNGYPDVVVVQEEDYFIPPFIWIDKNYAYCYGESSTPSSTWIHLLYPRGGETFVAGSVRFIEWTAAISAPGQPTMNIDLSLDGPAGPWLPVASSVPNNGRYQWSLTSGLRTSSNCHLRYTLAAVSAITPQPFTILGAPLPGDIDGDGDVDLDDFTLFAGCMEGPGVGVDPECENADLEGDDGDVDLADLAALQAVYGTGGPRPGEFCENPIEVTFGAGSPVYTDANTTCGRGNYYHDTCLGYYDGGEDIVYELTVLSPVDVQITLDPMEAVRTGLAIDDTCPPGESCIGYATEDAPGSPTIDVLHLETGTYYVMVDTWPLPDCIPEFTLTIEEVFGELVTCPPDGIPENEPCGDDTNGGCGLDPPQFEPLACMETICGTIWAADGYRDTDWFEVVAVEPVSFVWTAQAEFPVIIGLVETDPAGSGDCWDMTGYLDPWDTADMFPDVAEITTEMLPPGVYWFWISHQDFYGLPCSIMSDYVVTLECSLAP